MFPIMLLVIIFNSFIPFALFLSVMLMSYEYILFPIIFKKVFVYISITAFSLSTMKSYIYLKLFSIYYKIRLLLVYSIAFFRFA